MDFLYGNLLWLLDICVKSITFEIYLTTIVILVTLGLSGWWVYLMAGSVVAAVSSGTWDAIELAIFCIIGVTLFYGSLIYMFTRYGRLRRARLTEHPSPSELDTFFHGSNAGTAPSLTVLIPSYKEELRIIEMTIMSAALQEYPRKNIVLLLDDPASYPRAEDQALLDATLILPKRIESDLRAVQAHLDVYWHEYQTRRQSGKWDSAQEINALVEMFSFQLKWFCEQLESFGPQNHMEQFFVELKFAQGRDRTEQTIERIEELHNTDPQTLLPLIEQYYCKALSTFDVTVSVFQRKRYENLSHEPNKAMNLNSYIGLIGQSWKEVTEGGKLLLVNAEEGEGDLTVPATDYLITLDADSILAMSYARRLIYFLEQPGHESIAVAQTPYNTFHCPFIDLERVAGATTDIQHNVHQGFEYFHASYWVGANALLRYVALNDIKEVDTERGYSISRYVQDRTVIEDTESSIDLVVRGWEVFNYHERLAYSATPSDFGSLIIQRRRWANGGLIIFPKLVAYLFTGTTPLHRRVPEFMVRAHYLISTAFVSVSVLAMILYPFDGELHIVPLVMVAGFYFLIYARDLIQMGYSFTDLFRVYAMNLLLIPVNVAGTLKSIQQIITREKIPFGRTPKVDGRTAASVGIIAAELGLTLYMVLAVWFDLHAGRYEHAIFSVINAAFFLYAVTVFIGWRAVFEDVRAGLFKKESSSAVSGVQTSINKEANIEIEV